MFCNHLRRRPRPDSFRVNAMCDTVVLDDSRATEPSDIRGAGPREPCCTILQMWPRRDISQLTVRRRGEIRMQQGKRSKKGKTTYELTTLSD